MNSNNQNQPVLHPAGKVTLSALDADVKKNAKGRPNVSEIAKKPMPEPEKPLIIKDNAYYWEVEDATGRRSHSRISNFVITPLYLIRHNDVPLRIWEILNQRGEKVLLMFAAKDLSKGVEFRALVESKGFFVPSWKPGQWVTIKEHLLALEKSADLITTLGQQPESDFYAFSNGVFDGAAFHYVDEMGFARVGEKTFFLPAFSSATADAERLYKNERKFCYVPGEADFSTWAKRIFDVFGENGAIGTAFAVAALFRDVIFAEKNLFSLLFLFGPKGTGKSTFGLALKALFGKYTLEDAITLGGSSTPKAITRTLAQTANSLVRLEEYKNSIDKRLIETLKGAFDGYGHDKAAFSNDDKTYTSPVTQAVTVAGQELPVKETALLSRCILLSFGKTEYTEAEKSAYHALQEMIKNGLGKVCLEVLTHREKIKLGFAREAAEIVKRMRSEITTDERLLDSASVILAPVKILSGVLCFPLSYEQLYQAVKVRIEYQSDLMASSNEVYRFFEVFDYLAANNHFREGVNYLIDREGETVKSVSLHLESIYPKYYEQGARINLQVLDKSTLENYLRLSPAYIAPKPTEGRPTHRQRTIDGQQLRFWKFDAKKIELQIFSKDGHNEGF